VTDGVVVGGDWNDTSRILTMSVCIDGEVDIQAQPDVSAIVPDIGLSFTFAADLQASAAFRLNVTFYVNFTDGFHLPKTTIRVSDFFVGSVSFSQFTISPKMRVCLSDDVIASWFTPSE
jgi:hypothetical protein